MKAADVQAALLASTQMLDSQQIPYALMGALSLGFYDQARATHDVDVMIDGNVATFDAIRGVAARFGLQVDENWLTYNPGIRDTNLRLQLSGVPVDVMLPRDPQDQSAVRRRRLQVFSGGQVWVLAPEDIILQKLKAGRPRDFDDVIPFFTHHRDQLDHAYLNDWALRLGVREELDYLWSQSDRIPPPP